MTAVLADVEAPSLADLTEAHAAARVEMAAARAVADAAEAEFGEYSPEHVAAQEALLPVFLAESAARRAVKAAGGVPVVGAITYPVGPDARLAHWTDDVPTEVLAQWRRERRTR